MTETKRSKSTAAVVTAVVLAALGTAIGFGGPAAGQSTTVTAVSGEAFGLQAAGIIDVDPTPHVVLPPTGGAATDELLELDLSPLLTVGLLRVATEGQTGTNGFAESSATVADVRLLGTAGGVADPVLDLGGLLNLDQLLGGSGLFIEVLESECRATAQGVQGSTTIVGINEEGQADPGNTLTLGTGESLDVDLSPLVRVVLNEQHVVQQTGYNEIIVNGARVTLLGNDGNDPDPDPDALLDVILARSKCDVSYAQVTPTVPTTPTTTTTVLKPPTPGANNQGNVTNNSDGTAVVNTGDANAVGNASNTQINQSATARGGASGGGAAVGQDAAVVNVGDASANTGGNAAIGNNSTNVATNEQTAAAFGGGSAVAANQQAAGAGGGAGAAPTAGNTSHVTNNSDGTAVVNTGDANAVGNASNTQINQSATATGGSATPPLCTPEKPCYCGQPCTNPCPPQQPCPPCVPHHNPCQPCVGQPCQPCTGNPCHPCPPQHPCPAPPPPCGGSCWGSRWGGYGFWGGSSSVDQSATVVNSGSAQANTGGNTAVGNNSRNVASNNQTAVAAG